MADTDEQDDSNYVLLVIFIIVVVIPLCFCCRACKKRHDIAYLEAINPKEPKPKYQELFLDLPETRLIH